LEEALLVPEVRKSAAQIAALLADEFVEIGSSGPNVRRRGCQRNTG
jgi:hypothetical protein